MGFAPRSPRRTAGVDSADRDGDARVRRSEDCRGDSETKAELLPREPALQQLVVHTEGGAAPCVGVPRPLGEQTYRHHRSSRTDPRADESAQRARLADMARLSVARAEVAALTVHGCESWAPT